MHVDAPRYVVLLHMRQQLGHDEQLLLIKTGEIIFIWRTGCGRRHEEREKWGVKRAPIRFYGRQLSRLLWRNVAGKRVAASDIPEANSADTRQGSQEPQNVDR